MLGKSAASLAIVLVFRYPLHTALTISASLAQIGEFSFILGSLALSLGLLPPEAQSLLVGGALLSIALNPVAFGLIPALEGVLERVGARKRPDHSEGVTDRLSELPPSLPETSLVDHVVLVGYGPRRRARRIRAEPPQDRAHHPSDVTFPRLARL